LARLDSKKGHDFIRTFHFLPSKLSQKRKKKEISRKEHDLIDRKMLPLVLFRKKGKLCFLW
jgi:hypothetical protein